MALAKEKGAGSGTGEIGSRVPGGPVSHSLRRGVHVWLTTDPGGWTGHRGRLRAAEGYGTTAYPRFVLAEFGFGYTISVSSLFCDPVALESDSPADKNGRVSVVGLANALDDGSDRRRNTMELSNPESIRTLMAAFENPIRQRHASIPDSAVQITDRSRHARLVDAGWAYRTNANRGWITYRDPTTGLWHCGEDAIRLLSRNRDEPRP